MNTTCSSCDAPMTICVSDMVCTACGHSYRFRRPASSSCRPVSSYRCSVPLFNPPKNDFERYMNFKREGALA